MHLSFSLLFSSIISSISSSSFLFSIQINCISFAWQSLIASLLLAYKYQSNIVQILNARRIHVAYGLGHGAVAAEAPEFAGAAVLDAPFDGDDVRRAVNGHGPLRIALVQSV